MIKNMEHAYIQHGNKFFAFMEPVMGKKLDENTYELAHNFYVFDENGKCWCCLYHTDINFVLNGFSDGFFKTRTLYKIDKPVPAYREPIIPSDNWIQGNFDRGYALETIKEGLGLNLTYLTQLMKKENNDES